MKRYTEVQIKGDYEITFLIQNMFNSYTLTTRNSNIVTDEGLNIILQMLCGKTTRKFGTVYIGDNSTDASPLDTVSTFSHPTQLNASDIDVVENVLTYTINVDGSAINDTCEIGIWSDGDNPVLITRDVHDSYVVPSSAIITIKYKLTLSNRE